MICVITVGLQQTTKVIKICGIHENSLQVIQERLFQIVYLLKLIHHSLISDFNQHIFL